MNKDLIINEQGQEAFDFIVKYTGDSFDHSLILRTNDVFNIDLLDTNINKDIVNLNKINDINGINRFFKSVNLNPRKTESGASLRTIGAAGKSLVIA